MMAICAHLDQIRVEAPEEVAGCEDCLKIGGQWVHLRACRSCGHVACCDSSVMQHATKHFHDTTHPVMESAELGEDWRWCFVHHKTA